MKTARSTRMRTLKWAAAMSDVENRALVCCGAALGVTDCSGSLPGFRSGAAVAGVSRRGRRSVRLMDCMGERPEGFRVAMTRGRSRAGTPPTDKLYTGQQRETAGGVYHYKARMYNADTGRFPQADTVVADATEPRALNRYAYAYNSPAMNTDPTGHRVMDDAGPNGSNGVTIVPKPPPVVVVPVPVPAPVVAPAPVPLPAPAAPTQPPPAPHPGFTQDSPKPGFVDPAPQVRPRLTYSVCVDGVCGQEFRHYPSGLPCTHTIPGYPSLCGDVPTTHLSQCEQAIARTSVEETITAGAFAAAKHVVKSSQTFHALVTTGDSVSSIFSGWTAGQRIGMACLR
jgi:RHS repeat-associated protein